MKKEKVYTQMHYSKLFILFYLLWITIQSLGAQQYLSADTIINRLYRQTQIYPQESIYLHTDKDNYVAGDTVWLKAYIVNGISKKAELTSRYVYTELISPSDTVVKRVKMRQDEKQQIYGYLSLPFSLPQGRYLLRGYTRYSENWDESSFFHKELNVYAKRTVRNEEETSEAEDFQMDFFPEGGQMVAGTLNRIAYRAQGDNGKGVDTEGYLMAGEKDTILHFSSSHRGMGIITFIPQAEKNYYVRSRIKHGEWKQFEFPVAHSGTCALQILHRDKKFLVSFLKDSLCKADSLQLFVVQNGHPLYGKTWSRNESFYTFPYSLFHKGIVHFLLLDGNGQIMSERLAFVMRSDTVQATVTSEAFNEGFQPRHKVELQLTLADTLSHYLKGYASVSVTDNSYQWSSSEENIISRLFLTADLHGRIENPAWYFNQPYTPRVAAALDLVMLTHGWRKYDLSQTIQGMVQVPAISPEGSMLLEGNVKTRMNKPVVNAEVQVVAQGALLMETLHTDSIGRFRLEGFELPDSTRYMLTALSPKGKKNVVLQCNRETFPTFSFASESLEGGWLPDSISANVSVYVNNTITQLGYADGMRNILLGDVEVVANRRRQYRTEFEKDASTVIREERIKESGLPNLEMVIRGLGGLDFYHPRGETPALLVLDDVAIENSSGQVKNILHTMPPDNIEQVDIIIGPRAVGYFNGKHNCIVAVRTKRGYTGNAVYAETNIGVYVPLGYQKPVAFYSPKYDKKKQKDQPDLRSTICWKPDIEFKKGKATVSFYTADRTASYRIVLEGISENGDVFRQECFLFQ